MTDRTMAMACVGVILCSLALWIGASAVEARIYERLTGKHVTTLDAMFLDLRVQEQVREFKTTKETR